MNIRSSKQAKTCDISIKTKSIVWERDHHRCIICADPNAMPNAHFISRAKGGQGTEENIVTLCRRCHHEFDNGVDREYYKSKVETYLKSKYPNWDKERLVYQNRWANGNYYDITSQKKQQI